ncbi:unnamed protein product [Didymodactylos carnosus]|uniref:Uncharacterized protein n=1 Tax=Didymodactylos carnosus TaxID=1234261 RepID=A0A8S2EE86_9BILA|nr:unnamed protein product [Didymodactylos carnosus]CAF3907726.1 unnamed protein product [Didymodactylos carnosus]
MPVSVDIENDGFAIKDSSILAMFLTTNTHKGSCSEELVKQLARIQQERIRSTLPKIIDELRTQIQLKQIELDKLPSALTTESECLVRFGKLIKMYRELIFARVTGVYNNDLSMIMVDITLIK